MLLHVFSVFDSKAEAYLPPFFMISKGAAIRAFSDLVNQSDHDFAKHREDYTLFQLGSYDDSTGLIDTLPAPLSVGNALEFVR